MKFDPKEVGEAIEIYGRAQDPHDGSWNYFRQLFRNSGRNNPSVEIPLLGRVSVVQCDGEGTSDGSRVWMVFEVASPYEDHNENGARYFKVTGVYDSYDEVSWTGAVSEVQPKERMIVSYEYI